MSFKFSMFTTSVLPGLQANNKTLDTLKGAIDAFTKSCPLVDEDGTTPITVEVKEADGKIQVIKTVQAPDPVAAALGVELKTMISEAVKLATSSLQKQVVVGPDNSTLDKTGGYKHVGEFFQDVAKSAIVRKEGGIYKSERFDNYLAKSFDMIAKTTGPTAPGDTSGLGAVIPQEFADKIYEYTFDGDEIFNRVDDSLKIAGDTIKIPFDTTTPWGGSGVQARWTDEGGQMTQDAPVINPDFMTLHKLATLVVLTNELINDSPFALGAYCARKASYAIRYEGGKAVFYGSGVKQPLGFMRSGAALPVARNTFGDIKTVDVQKLVASLYSEFKNPVLFCNQLTLPTIQNLPNISAGTAFSIYTPPGFAGNKYATLLGVPLIPVVHGAPLGYEGDLIGACLDQYLLIQKTVGIEGASSIHLFFDYDLSCFRFTWRIDGRPWMDSPITLPQYVGLEGSGSGTSEGQVAAFSYLER